MKLIAAQLDHGKESIWFLREDEIGRVYAVVRSCPRYLLLEIENTLKEDYGFRRTSWGNAMHCNLIDDNYAGALYSIMQWGLG